MTNTIPNVTRELKPCPFCGGEPNLTTADYVHDDLTPMPVVECKSCSAWVQADDWNTRAPSPAGVDGLDGVSERIAKVWTGLIENKTPYLSVTYIVFAFFAVANFKQDNIRLVVYWTASHPIKAAT